MKSRYESDSCDLEIEYQEDFDRESVIVIEDPLKSSIGFPKGLSREDKKAYLIKLREFANSFKEQPKSIRNHNRLPNGRVL